MPIHKIHRFVAAFEGHCEWCGLGFYEGEEAAYINGSGPVCSECIDWSQRENDDAEAGADDTYDWQSEDSRD